MSTLYHGSFHQSDNDVFLRVDAAAWDLEQKGGPLKLLSAVGSRTSVQGVAAMLRNKQSSMGIRFTEREGGFAHNCTREDYGFKCWNVLLAMDTWHLLAISKDPSLLPAINDDQLWNHLRSDRFTTPILRDWIPSLRAELTENNIIRPLYGFGHAAGVMHLGDPALDALVSEGIRAGRLAFPRRAS